MTQRFAQRYGFMMNFGVYKRLYSPNAPRTNGVWASMLAPSDTGVPPSVAMADTTEMIWGGDVSNRNTGAPDDP